MYQTTLNNETIQIDFTTNGPTLNGDPYVWDLVQLTERTFHILHQNHSYSAEVLQVDKEAKAVRLKINGHIHHVQVKDRFDLLLEKMGMSSTTHARVNELKAPMPGLIVGINVQPGEVIEKGGSVLILEAMKMENVLKVPSEVTVKAIRVAKGDRVEKGQVLIEFA